MTKNHAFNTYSQHPPFNNLSDKQLDNLSAHAITHNFKTNDTLYRVGDTEQTLSIIEEGQVQITSLSKKGNLIDLQTVGKGNLIGEIGFLSGHPHRTDAIARTSTKILSLPRVALKPLIDDSPELLNGLIDILCRKISFFQDTYPTSLNAPLKTRLAKKLLSLSEHTISGQIFLSHEALGQSLGSCRESVSRCLAGFRNAGIIQTGHSCIQILDREKLKQFTFV